MGEPSQDPLPAQRIRSYTEQKSFEQLLSLAAKQFPGGSFVPTEDGQAFVTVHGAGKDQREALETAIRSFQQMKEDGESFPEMLDQVSEMLAQRGMSRERHDSIMSILDQCSTALNDGIIAGVINPLMVPSYNRTLEDYKRRVATRLMMLAQEMQDREKAKSRASQTFPRPEQSTPLETDGLSQYDLWKRGLTK